MSKNEKVTYELRFVQEDVSSILRNGEIIGSYNSSTNVVSTIDGFDKFHNSVRRFIKSYPVIQPLETPTSDVVAHEPVEPPREPVKAQEKITGKQGPRGIPAYPDAPTLGPGGDKYIPFIEWLYKNHPKDAAKRYKNRLIERA
tara:strand:- start:1672 stop:2100 length:429 start_codon:yes stop_codon:yes gene_type:complete